MLSTGERQEIAALIAAALASEPARLLGEARRARREYPFAFSLGGGEPLVTGVLDLLVEQPDGSALIVDYKSDRLAGGEDLELLVQHDYGYPAAALRAGRYRGRRLARGDRPLVPGASERVDRGQFRLR